MERKTELFQKKTELEQACGVDLNALPFCVRHFLLGDYLTRVNNTVTTRHEVVRRCSVLDRVVEIVRTCAGAHPKAAFDFCLENIDAGAQEFYTLREKMRAVFRMFGLKILHKVPLSKLKDLTDSPLADVYMDFTYRDSKALIRGQLLQWMDEGTADAIMKDPACEERIENGSDEFIIAKKLKEFWEEKGDYQKREQKLNAFLSAKGIRRPRDSTLCSLYLNGELDCDIEEVVGEINLKEIFDLHQCPHGWRLESAFECLQENLHEEKMEYEEAVEEAFDAIVDYIPIWEEEFYSVRFWDPDDLFDVMQFYDDEDDAYSDFDSDESDF